MGGWLAGRGGIFIVSLMLAGTLLCPGGTRHGIALADQKGEAPVPREERGAVDSGEAAEANFACLRHFSVSPIPWRCPLGARGRRFAP